MSTKAEIEQFMRDVESLGLRFPVAQIARETGYSKGNVSDYLNGSKLPSDKFMKAFYSAYKSSLIVPQETPPSEQVIETLKQKVSLQGALLSVLVSELAALRASISGEHPEVIVKKIYKAAEDVARLQGG